MLEVVTTDDRKFTVYIGSPEQAKRLRQIAHLVMFLYADGDELAYIETTFKNLPNAPKHNLVNYYGDFAKFIAGNWLG